MSGDFLITPMWTKISFYSVRRLGTSTPRSLIRLHILHKRYRTYACYSRRSLWSNAGRWLANKGTLLLTIDLYPRSERLWNYCLEKLVETTEAHGDLDTLERELADAGLPSSMKELLRDLPNCRVDIAFMHLTRT